MKTKDRRTLVNEVAKFSRDVLGMDFHRYFLRRWGRTVYDLHVSDKNGLFTPNLDNTIIHSYNFNTIYHNKMVFENKGFDTLLYSVYGRSNGFSKKLMDFSPESVTQVLFHEILHNHYRANHIPYNSFKEESLADAFGYLSAIEFSKTNSLLNTDYLIESEKIFEEFSSFIKDSVETVCIGTNTKEFYNNSKRNLKEIISKFDPQDYQKQRIDYEFNNAFLLRYKDYCYNYPHNKDIILGYSNINMYIRDCTKKLSYKGCSCSNPYF